MLFFEFFPAVLMLLCIAVGVWLVAMDRQARSTPIEEQTTRIRYTRPRP